MSRSISYILACTLILSGCQTATRADATKRTVAESNYANERTDWGVTPRDTLLIGGYHSRTPLSAPGVSTVSTAELQKMLGTDPSIILIDVLGGSQHASLPDSVWLVDAGLGKEFDDPMQKKLGNRLTQLTGGDSKRPLVFYCLSPECWLSYNASLRAKKLGYQNVAWYRGGIEAWKAADLPTSLSTTGW